MKLSEFDYELPEDRIAQHPIGRRDDSRLLLLDRESGSIAHRRFRDLADLLDPGDLLVFNDTRVRPSRVVGRKPTGGRVELLLLDQDDQGRWRCLMQASRRPEVGGRILFDRELSATVVGYEDQMASLRFEHPGGESESVLESIGRMPLPPYIRRSGDAPEDAEDRERYQTVYARSSGAVAAPTAGLHFTEALLARLADRGVARAFLSLHVGIGTFLPVRAERIEDHRMHAERFEINSNVAEAVAAARRRGGRVVAVGTTSVRALEACATPDGSVVPGVGSCDLFIRPGYRFRVVDSLITNFHLPRSTLLMLVAAVAGRESVLAAYREAIRMGYRFYSYGDAMWIRSPR